MPNDDLGTPGWSFSASGNTTDSSIVDRIRSGVEAILSDTAFGKKALEFLTTAEGWIVSSHGATADADAHHGLFARLRDLISAPDAATGSSSFTSPYVAQSNFHTASSSTGGTTAETAAAAAGPDASASEGTGETPSW